jgi:hypothetical protein
VIHPNGGWWQFNSPHEIRGASACLHLSFRNIEQTVEIILGSWGRGANGNTPSLLNKPSLFANNQVYLKRN